MMNKFKYWFCKKFNIMTSRYNPNLLSTPECKMFYNQPERLNDSTRKGCESLNSCENMREESEEALPPDPFKCAKCEMSFDPSDWDNDICDNSLYNRKRS